MVSFTFIMRRHLIQINSHWHHLPPPVWLCFVGFCLSCTTPDNEAERRIYRGQVKTPVLLEAVCGSKFMKFSDDVGDSSYFRKPLPIVYTIFRSEDIRHIVEKPNKCIKFLWPPIFQEGRSQFFYGRLSVQFTFTVWQSLVEFHQISVCKVWQ